MKNKILLFLISVAIVFASSFIYSAELMPIPVQRWFDSNGLPLAGGKMYFYEAGTSTPKATYTTRAGTTANANPVILDANGQADIWLGSGYYKVVLKDSSDVTQWTKDQISIAAEAVLASAFWRDVVYITSTDSPYTLTQALNGKLISVDTTSGAVTINMPEISGLILLYNIGIKRTTGSNNVTISRAGTDTIDTATSKTLATANAAAQLMADSDKSPDDWSSLDIGTVSDGLINGFTTVTPVAADSVAIADASDSGKNKKALVSGFKNAVYRSVTTTDTVGADDETMKLSGASFTSTLPTAVGISGKRYKFIHAGTSLTQLYTIATTSSQTIGAQAVTSFILATAGEILEVESDNANWVIVGRFTDTSWVNSGNIVLSATTSAPTRATTRETDKLWWRRSGDSAIIRIEYGAASATGAATGSGDYLFGVPANMTIDTAKVTVNATVGSPFIQPGVVGNFVMTAAGSIYNGGSLYVYDATYVRASVTNSASTSVITSAFGAINNANLTYSGTFIVPITNWQP